MAMVPKELPRTGTLPLPAELLTEMADDAGLGVSADADDLVIPRLKVIQKTSVAIDPQRFEYLNGARPGDFLLGISELRNGSDGLEVVPAAMSRYWVEVAPDRTFIGRHATLPADAAPIRDGNRPVHRRANGNVLEDIREFALLVEGANFLLACRGTAHRFARNWQTLFHSQRHPTTGKVLPSFASKYRLTAIPAQNQQGNWYGLRAELIGRVTDPAEYAAAKALNQLVSSGAYEADDREDDGADYSPIHRSQNDPFQGL
jgi:hypothetical protein